MGEIKHVENAPFTISWGGITTSLRACVTCFALPSVHESRVLITTLHQVSTRAFRIWVYSTTRLVAAKSLHNFFLQLVIPLW